MFQCQFFFFQKFNFLCIQPQEIYLNCSNSSLLRPWHCCQIQRSRRSLLHEILWQESFCLKQYFFFFFKLSAPLQHPLHEGQSTWAHLCALTKKHCYFMKPFLVLSQHIFLFQDVLPKPIPKQYLFILYFYFTSVSIRY